MPLPLFLLTTPHLWTSAVVLATLVVIFAASWITFWKLAERSIEQRHQVAVSDWGRERGFYLQDMEEEDPPAPLHFITSRRLTIHTCLAGRKSYLVLLQSFAPGGTAAPGETEPASGMWNVLIQQIPTNWPPTGLRPSSAGVSLLDLFSLTSFPLLSAADRFVVFGSESRAATALSRSSARGLLPPDVGLLLHGNQLMLDFSMRPFDTIEFERMIVVAGQIISHLIPPDADA